jgi:3-isopropylmalate/(R)-2-methylmalate dehydratase large subunit
MTPAWVCFATTRADIALERLRRPDRRRQRLFPERDALDGNFEVIVSGRARASAARARPPRSARSLGHRLAIASSFAPIHARNNINLGQLMGDHALLARLEAGEAVRSTSSPRPRRDHRAIIEAGGLLPFSAKLAKKGAITVPRPAPPRPMNLTEKILAAKLVNGPAGRVREARRRGAGQGRRRLLARVHHRAGPRLPRPASTAPTTGSRPVEVRGVRGPPDLRRRRAAHGQVLGQDRDAARPAARVRGHTGVRDFGAKDGVSPGICHQVAREQFIDPGDFVQATDSHTCMGGGVNALSWGVGATEYAALAYWGFTPLAVPESIRFELTGALASRRHRQGRDAHILANLRQARGDAQPRDGVRRRRPVRAVARRARDAGQHGDRVRGARRMMEVDDRCSLDRGPPGRRRARAAKVVRPIPARTTTAASHDRPGDDRADGRDARRSRSRHRLGSQERRADRRPGPGQARHRLRRLVHRRQARRHRHVRAGHRRGRARRQADRRRRRFFIQFGSTDVEDYARAQGYLELFARTGVEIIKPGCGACIGCGPGVSDRGDQVTVSAINRNYKGRSGPGQLYLASPLTVAASAIAGEIVAYRDGMFDGK